MHSILFTTPKLPPNCSLCVQIKQDQELSSTSCIPPCCSGPIGKVLLMLEYPNAVFITVATGTGIVPYTAF